jgi:hypothetical protein
MKKGLFALIIRDKADFLITLQVDFPEALQVIHEKKEVVDRIYNASGPYSYTRRFEKGPEASAELTKANQHLALKIGARVLDTYRFVEQHRALLPKKIQKKLFGEDPK